MERHTLTIVVLSIAAVALSLAIAMTPPPALAQVTAKDRDYTVVTARTSAGGDGVYIADNRTGIVAVFTYDPASRTIRARTARPLSDAFLEK